MKLVTVEAMRAAERRTSEEFKVPMDVLMERAGQGAAVMIIRLARMIGQPQAEVLLLAGKGNNGGDAFATATRLQAFGLHPTVWLTSPQVNLQGAAAIHFDRMQKSGVPWVEKLNSSDWDEAMNNSWSPPIMVDGLLGIGARGEPEGTIHRAIDFLRTQVNRSFVVALDVPSGLHPDTGIPSATTVLADLTLTFGFPKVGLVAETALEYVGTLVNVDIGLPHEVAFQVPFANSHLEFVSVTSIRKVLPRRHRISHKGTWGKVLLIGGTRPYPGSITLAADAALRSGAGLVHVLTVESTRTILGTRAPEAIMHTVPSDMLDASSLDHLPRGLGYFNAILIGPGLGRSEGAVQLITRLLKETSCPLVLDADAVNLLAGAPERIAACAHPVVLTPHAAEMATLLGRDVAYVQQHRQASIEEGVKRSGATIVLKGAGTLIAQGTRPVHINVNGNPGMATGGTGDVLSGLLTGLLGQRLTPFDAARAAVWLHGHAGDVAALRMTMAAMKAGDVTQALPDAFRLLSAR